MKRSIGALVLLFVAVPSPAFADNCGSLSDCYGTILAAVLVALAIILLVALVIFLFPEVFALGAGAEAVAGTEITAETLATVAEHLAQFGEYAPNTMMLQRLEAALEAGEALTGADANFFLHELYEANLMGQGMEYEAAHQAAIDFYGVSPYSLYHPEVIEALAEYFNANWFRFWGLTPP